LYTLLGYGIKILWLKQPLKLSEEKGREGKNSAHGGERLRSRGHTVVRTEQGVVDTQHRHVKYSLQDRFIMLNYEF